LAGAGVISLEGVSELLEISQNLKIPAIETMLLMVFTAILFSRGVFYLSIMNNIFAFSEI
jgi:hypothetical protein